MRRRAVVVASALVAALAWAALSLALPQQQGSVDLLSQADGQWQGPAEAAGSSAAGSSLAGLPDVFRDGRSAVAIGAPGADPDGRQSAGSVYVVAGNGGRSIVDLTALSGRGFRIDGASPGNQLGFSLTEFRLADGDPGLAIGAPYAAAAGHANAGAVYVIDLHRLHGDLDLAARTLDRAVVSVITGPGACAEAGYALADAGPTGHGRGEGLLIGAPGVDPHGCPNSTASGPVGGNTGAAYLLYPSKLRRVLALGAGGSAAATFTGVSSGDRAGSAVSASGIPGAVAVGAPYASAVGRLGAGVVYLVRGARPGTSLSLAHLPSGSTTFEGAAANDALGFSLSSTVVLRGRGGRSTPQLILGAPQGNPYNRNRAGSVFVVPAVREPAVADLSSVAKPGGSAGTRIDGADAGDELGYSVAGLGDLNGDGRPDIAVGAPFANSQTGQDRMDDGAVYVLYGALPAGIVDLATTRYRGYAAFGARDSDEAGTAVAGVTDESGDGRPDLLVGAPYAENSTGATPAVGGAAYVLYGFGAPALRYRRSSVTLRVGERLSAIYPSIRATGVPTFAVSPALPAGLKLDRRTGRISGVARRAAPLTLYTVEMTDLAGVSDATLTLSVTRR